MFYEKKFAVDNIRYRFWVEGQNEINFSVLRAASKRGAISWADTEGIGFDDVNLSMSPFKVLNKVSQLTLQWVRQAGYPWQFSFCASTGRKFFIYRRLVERALRQNPDIAQHYYFYLQGNLFQFYRKKASLQSH